MLAIEAASFTLRIGALFSTSEKNDIDFVTLDMGHLVLGVQGTRTVEPSPWIAHFSDLAILSLDSTSLAEWTRSRSAGTDLFTCSRYIFFWVKITYYLAINVSKWKIRNNSKALNSMTSLQIMISLHRRKRARFQQH